MDWEVVDVPTHPLSGSDWVAIVAQIRDNETGEVRDYEATAILDHGDHFPDTWIWTDGNYSCDCNRRLFFGYAVGEKYEDIDHQCSDGEFSVRLKNKMTGEIYYDELEES